MARVGVGVTVRRGVTPPDVGTVEALRQALLQADSVVYNQASTGLYLEKLFGQLGIADALKAKTTRYPNGPQVFEHVLRGVGREIGFGAITEIKTYEAKGLLLVGPLPQEVQNHTTYVAAVMNAASAPDAAQAFIRYLTSPPARRVFAATGGQ